MVWRGTGTLVLGPTAEERRAADGGEADGGEAAALPMRSDTPVNELRWGDQKRRVVGSGENGPGAGWAATAAWRAFFVAATATAAGGGSCGLSRWLIPHGPSATSDPVISDKNL